MTNDNTREVNAISWETWKAEETWGQFSHWLLCFQCDSNGDLQRPVLITNVRRSRCKIKLFFLTSKLFFQQHCPHGSICQRRGERCPSGHIHTNYDLKLHCLKHIAKIWLLKKCITLPSYSEFQHNSLQLCEVSSALSSWEAWLLGWTSNDFLAFYCLRE